ncbi:hypothetical protein Clacol_009762 [Clathrus columnatus]|uniref:Uncharacterized protein n=1 Tax=Clathrus columnatus TaxID=1419009 RepID=A0AAV5AQP9_9AGAM|nr:hypothetical protein Clacol_009762 [Clathrus columnatus]
MSGISPSPSIRIYMPFPGSNSAPRTFTGNEDEIVDFLENFEYCAAVSQIQDSDKVTSLIRYLSKEQKDIFRVFDGFDEKNWTTFLESIKEEFKEAFKMKVHTRNSLLTLAREASATPISTASNLRKYNRHFQAIAKSLVKTKVITGVDKDTYFWFGLHEQTRAILKLELRLKYPCHPLDRPYPSAAVLGVGIQVFADDAFDRNPPADLVAF